MIVTRTSLAWILVALLSGAAVGAIALVTVEHDPEFVGRWAQRQDPGIPGVTEVVEVRADGSYVNSTNGGPFRDTGGRWEARGSAITFRLGVLSATYVRRGDTLEMVDASDPGATESTWMFIR